MHHGSGGTWICGGGLGGQVCSGCQQWADRCRVRPGGMLAQAVARLTKARQGSFQGSWRTVGVQLGSYRWGGALVVCTVVGCIFSTASFRGKNQPWSWLWFKGPRSYSLK